VNSRRTHSRTLSLTIAALAVLIPAAALAALQLRALVTLERETRAAVRESLRQTIRAYEDSMTESVYRISLQMFEEIAEIDPRPDRLDSSVSRLRDMLEDIAEVDQIAVARLCECPERFELVVSREEDWLSVGDGRSSWPFGLLRSRAQVPRRGPDRVSFAQIEDLDGPEDFELSRGVYAFMRLERHTISLRISRRVLLNMARETIRSSDRESRPIGAPQFILVRADEGTPVDSDSRMIEDEPELTVGFGEPLSGWALAAVYSDRSIAEIARQSFLYNLALLAAVLAALVGGVVLSLRAFARQAKLAEMKSSFVSNVSHEMRTPLALISLYSETLEMDRIDEPSKVREYHRVIHRESKRLTQMVNNVLDFSRIESGRVDYRRELCDVEDIVNEVLSGYRDPITRAGFDLEVEIAANLPPIDVDSTAVSQTLLNLVDNAMKYSPIEKSIAIRAYDQQGYVAIEVEDHGVGISASDQLRIFDKFHRVGDPLTPATRGSGLGLALAKHSVEAHGGHIEVDSVAGRGSRFTILLPAEPKPLESKEAA